MLFNSWQFVIFSPVVFALYWALPDKFRSLVILISSYYFYMSWNVNYIVLILFTTIISYLAALLIRRYDSAKKFILALSLIACLGVLFVFKYYNFFADSLVNFLNLFALKLQPFTLKLALPVGISFYTFQTLSYVIDVYRGNTEPEKNFIYYAAFVSFFPQLVAGPIERTNNLLPQIKAKHVFNYNQALYGVKLMMWGFFKKLIIAEISALLVDQIFNDIYNYRGLPLIIGAFLFAIQIYCDFSGYSDIAIGTAKLMGIDLMQNFKSPYFSASIKEFWSRWHISLSTWFRDYVYIPLGGNRVKKFRHCLNLFITFMISGLWHGANWTFILWGSLHGLAQILENFTRPKNYHGFKWALKVSATFIFVMLAFMIFRANNINDVIYIFSNIFKSSAGFELIDIRSSKIYGLIISIIVLALWDYASLKYDVIEKVTSCKNIFLRYGFYFLLVNSLIFFRSIGSTQFVYFQF